MNKSFAELQERKKKYTGFYKANGKDKEATRDQFGGSMLQYMFSGKVTKNDSVVEEFKKVQEEMQKTGKSARVLYNEADNMDYRIAKFFSTVKGGNATEDDFINFLNQSTLKSKAAAIGVQVMAAALNVALEFAITSAIQVITSFITANDRLAESAQKASQEFSEEKSSIEDYKTRISELRATIHDSGSSYEEVTSAREDLLTIQDELIAKYGKEEGAINVVTNAINGQINALDELTKKNWDKTVADFNNSDKWYDRIGDWMSNNLSGSKNNFERMIKEYENASAKFSVILSGTKQQSEEFKKAINEIYGGYFNDTEKFNGEHDITIGGDLDEVYTKLQSIKDLAASCGVELGANFDKVYDNTVSNLGNYEDLYNQHILNDVIFDNSKYTDYFNQINDAYKKYQDAFTEGNEEATDQNKIDTL